jgi:hypothetical protein
MTVQSPSRHARRNAYENRLHTLSVASVEQHFDAFKDIAWDDPDYAISLDDPRWILPAVDPVGRTSWYQALTLDEQIRVGLYRQANVVKVGLQFEQILVAGLMNYAFRLPNGTAEFRYSTHEATEETQHTQMFQEFVNRSGMDVPGGSRFFRAIGPILPLAARLVPLPFFIGVLAGEEPIDHVQKSMLRADGVEHPLLQRIMQIHIAEEARHIGFAHEYVSQHAPKLSWLDRHLIALATPVIMRWLCDEILKPSKRARRDMGMPDAVFKELFWDAPESQVMLRGLFGDVRMLMESAGLMTFSSRRVWRAFKIDGKASRYRSEPAPKAA